jgi:cytidyltransferase-like protein
MWREPQNFHMMYPTGRPAVIIAPGNFDLFHAGHVRFLKRLTVYGRVCVALNRDEFAARYKRPTICPLEERIDLLRACRFVTDVYVNEGDEDASDVILRSGCTHIAHGNDWMGDSLLNQLGIDQAFLDQHGIEMLYVPYSHGVSTTEIIERCQAKSDVTVADCGSTRTTGSALIADTSAPATTRGWREPR